MNQIAPITAPGALAINALDMATFDGAQWEAVYDALSLALAGVGGIVSQPRCETAGRANAAGHYLDAIVVFLEEERARLIDALAAYDTSDHLKRKMRANLLVRAEAEFGELSMPELAAYALSLSAEKN